MVSEAVLWQEAERRAAYNCDVTYVTNSELGFDYLRDNLAQVSLPFVVARLILGCFWVQPLP